MFVALRWRIDTHHDGAMFLPAVMGKNNALPQESLFYTYGIAQPFLEGLIFKIVPVSLINHRIIAFILITITGYFLYKIISLKLSKGVSWIFSLTWMFANPTWANSTDYIPTDIQANWPNLWLQTIFIFCIYIVQKTRLKTFLPLLLVSTFSGSLPFFRIQGLIYTFFVALLIFLIARAKLVRYLILLSLVIFSWLTLIQFNGGISLYLTNTLTYPRKYYSLLTTQESFVNFLTHSTVYYLVCGFMLLQYFYIIGFAFLKINYWEKSLYLLLCALAFCILIQFEFKEWIGILRNNSSAIILDSFIPIAALSISIWLIFSFRVGTRLHRTSHELLLFYSFASFTNLVFQFPLPDLGHRWWSSAILALVIAEIYALDFKQYFKLREDFKNTAILIGCIASIAISSVQGFNFLRYERNDLVISNPTLYEGMQYPDKDQESIDKFGDSLKILIYLESLGVKVDYVCRNGLYYLRENYYVTDAKNFIYSSGKERQDMSYSNKLSSQATFYCNTDEVNINNIKQFNYFSIGKVNPNIFVFNSSDVYKKALSFYREQ